MIEHPTPEEAAATEALDALSPEEAAAIVERYGPGALLDVYGNTGPLPSLKLYNNTGIVNNAAGSGSTRIMSTCSVFMNFSDTACRINVISGSK